ncbi:TonB-dependent receptor [Colwellia sp. UCD-KL20]|uniref:TonB-dependent receptor plug domain-containing protein n=1 Tax=Colwellia sp. UCD-KL20 TaxID=1917165 RepID=UPI00097083D3|nr:TonB-dependent receptor [Colwellia sp. UCD-KL20]
MKLIALSLLAAFSVVPNAFSQDYTLEENDDYFVDFYGSEELVEIATGIKTQIYKAPAVASVFTSQQIKSMGATDIDDVLEAVPGLHVSRNAVGYNPIYSFRGVHSSYNSQVLMLVNGIPITNNFVGDRGQVWGGMPVEAIARIEIIRGPGSAIYGADAFSGVINIITKNADSIQKNEVSVRLGTNSTKDAWFSLSGQQKDLKYSTVIEYHKTDGSNKIIEQDAQTLLDKVFNTNVSNAPGQLNLSTENIDIRTEVNYQAFTLRAGYQFRNNTGVGTGLGEALDLDVKQKSTRYNIDINYIRHLTDTWQLTAQASYFNTSQQVKNNYLIYPVGADIGLGAPFKGGLIGNPENWEQQSRVNISSIYNGINKHTLTLGVGYFYSDLYRTQETKNYSLGPRGKFIPPGSPLIDVSDTPYVFLRETDRTNRYIFVQDLWSIANDWELTAGVRYDNYSDFGNTTNPRLALVWSTNLNLSTKLLYGKAFRAPSYADIGNINNPVALGNPDLKPEEIETTELAFDYHPGSGFGAILSFYYYEWDNIIQYIPDQNGNTAQNFGKQIAHGSELELNWKVSNNISISANYAISKAENKNTNTKVANVPEQQIYTQINWNISDTISLNFKNNFVKNRLRNFDDPRDNISNYWTSDISMRWESDNAPIELAIIAKNILDKDAREPSFNNGPTVNIPNDLPLSERYLHTELRYKF